MRAGFLFQINHVDPPLRVKGAGAGLIGFNIQRKFGDVNDKIGSGLKVQRLNENKGAKRICKAKRGKRRY